MAANGSLDDVVKYRTDEAHGAHGRGWALMPLIGKKPVLCDWPNQPKASLDQVLAWARKGNLGLRTGAVSGVFVIDEDRTKGGDVTPLNLPLTSTVETGGGGRHFYFRSPTEPLGNSASKLGDGIDTKGDGGQVVFPGSVHPDTGKVYRWAKGLSPDDIPLATLPEHVVALLRRAHPSKISPAPSATTEKTRYASVALDREVQNVRSAPEHTRNNTLNAAAFNLGQLIAGGQIPLQEVEEALLDAAFSAGLDEHEARATIRSGVGAGSERPRKPDRRRKVVALDGTRSQKKSDVSGSGSRGQAALPAINAGDGNLPRMAEHAWKVLKRANTPPQWFRYGAIPSRVERDDKKLPVVQPLTKDRWRFVLARVARWFKVTRAGEVEVPPPMIVVRDMLARPEPPLPILTRILEAPALAADGTLQSQPGYHAGSQCIYAPPPGFVFPTVPERPTSAEIDSARSLILDDLLVDFPFIGIAERAHAVALGLLPFVRNLINGPTPLHIFEKPTPGTGATLLVDALLHAALSHPVPTMTEGKDEDEWRKRITSKLLQGPAVVLIDNIRHRLESSALAGAITAPLWEDRILGRSEMARIPVRCAWVATGNNPTVSNEMARRSIRIRLDAKVDMPWKGRAFKHPELREWVRESRGELVWAFLVLARAWVIAGRPEAPASGPLGMFEEWSRVLGGILHHAGIDGFLENLDEFYETSDTEATAWRTFVGVWFETFGEQPVGVSQLFELVQDKDIFDLGDKSDKSQRTRLGRLIGRQRDRQFGRFRILAAGEAHGAKQWRLGVVPGAGSGASSER